MKNYTFILLELQQPGTVYVIRLIIENKIEKGLSMTNASYLSTYLTDITCRYQERTFIEEFIYNQYYFKMYKNKWIPEMDIEGRKVTRRPCRWLCHFLRCSLSLHELRIQRNNALFYKLWYANAFYGTVHIITKLKAFLLTSLRVIYIRSNRTVHVSPHWRIVYIRALVSHYDHGTFILL